MDDPKTVNTNRRSSLRFWGKTRNATVRTIEGRNHDKRKRVSRTTQKSQWKRHLSRGDQ